MHLPSSFFLDSSERIISHPTAQENLELEELPLQSSLMQHKKKKEREEDFAEVGKAA